jgi:Xanthomonas XOO_2897-like deaminase
MSDGGISKIIDEVSTALEKTGGKISTAIGSRLHGLGQATRKAAKEFEDADGKLEEHVPVYMVDHDGNVNKLVGGKFVPAKGADGELADWAKNDKSGIKNLMDGEGKTTDPQGRYGLNDKPLAHDADEGRKVRRTVKSGRVDPDKTDLSKATAAARIAGKDNKKVNYAAFHYQDEAAGHDFILVGKSNADINAHSEQVAGVPFLAHKMSHNVTAVYTERAPCVKGQRNCDAWLGRYFRNDNLKVTHTFDYDVEKSKLANKQMGRYISGLFH